MSLQDNITDLLSKIVDSIWDESQNAQMISGGSFVIASAKSLLEESLQKTFGDKCVTDWSEPNALEIKALMAQPDVRHVSSAIPIETDGVGFIIQDPKKWWVIEGKMTMAYYITEGEEGDVMHHFLALRWMASINHAHPRTKSYQNLARWIETLVAEAA